MNLLTGKRLYLPAVTVVAIVVALVVLHAVSTFQTLDRERRHREDFLERNARDFVFAIKVELNLEKPDPAKLRKFINRMAENPDIAYLTLVDRKGARSSGSSLPRIPESSLKEDRTGPDSRDGAHYRRLVRLPDGRPVFELTEYPGSGDFRSVTVGLWMTAFEDARKQDERHALMMVVILLLLGGAAIYFIVVVQHYYLVNRRLGEMREKVHRSERLASLGTLASGVAHEVRNPLSAIKGFAQYFRDKFQEGSEDRSYADVMIQEAERLNRVIDDLLSFARPRDLNVSLYPLSEILGHPLRLIRHDLDTKEIGLTTDLPEAYVRVDPDQMTQAFLNIFINALDSMGKGGDLHIAAFPKPEEGKVEIRISDSGAGISREDLSRIFDPFFTTKKKGTGLGLAITATIIEAHQGDISVESRRGNGTVFKIHLPLEAAAREEREG